MVKLSSSASRAAGVKGQVLTPDYLVAVILDMAGYEGDAVLCRHVADNSCGDGAFLVEVVRRYCVAHTAAHGVEGLAEALSLYVHGVEIDEVAWRVCVERLDAVAEAFGVRGVAWDVRCADALSVRDWDGKMDFVAGNPPYVRVHDLAECYGAVKSFGFAQGGMTDLYLVFFELGVRMLRRGGKLCYITPSSWFGSVAGGRFRDFLRRSRSLRAVVDLAHFQPFDGAMTYTAVTMIERGVVGEAFDYYTFDASARRPVLVSRLPFSLAFYVGTLSLGTEEEVRAFLSVMCAKRGNAGPRVEVKNGFATLADDVFVGDALGFEAFTIPVLKASTGRWTRAFYPYDACGSPLDRAMVFGEARVAAYLDAHKARLLKGRDEADCPFWWLYGRTQALRDVRRRKFAVNTCIRDVRSVKLCEVPAGCGLYSGLYVVGDVEEGWLREVVCSEDFLRFVRMLRKYKSGGYYTFSSRDLQQYLNFKLDAKIRKNDE